MTSIADSSWLSVSQLTALIRQEIETGFESVAVEGEVSNLKLASSGHMYFSLKDAGALLSAVMFRFSSRVLDFIPADGMRVRATGSITVYPPRGAYQLLVKSMRMAGAGDLLADIEERKRRLALEGLFDQDRKRPLPRFPRRVVVVTSASGAALRDILSILGRRNAGINVRILPASVQGSEAPSELISRIEMANAHDLGDVLILGRGGGSIEDLLAFSDESVVRAIAGSRIPTISAVGHETDWSIADLAADVRAPTPSAAAELVSESREVVLREILQFKEVLAGSIGSRLAHARNSVSRFEPSAIEAYFMRRISPISHRVSGANERLYRSIQDKILSLHHRISNAKGVVEASSPVAIMGRGYAVVRVVETGEVLRSLDQTEKGDAISIQLAKGRIGASVKSLEL